MLAKPGPLRPMDWRAGEGMRMRERELRVLFAGLSAEGHRTAILGRGGDERLGGTRDSAWRIIQHVASRLSITLSRSTEQRL